MKIINLSVIFLLCWSCNPGGSPEALLLPETPVLENTRSFGVVNFPRLRVRTAPSLDSDFLTQIRGGSILEVLTISPRIQTLEQVTGRWFEIQYRGVRGWVFGPYLELFPTLEEAQAFSAEY